MSTFTINNCNFNDNAAVERNETNIFYNEIDFGRIEAELHEIKSKLSKGTAEYQAVEKLENGAEGKDWKAITTSIAKFTGQFASSVLSGLAGTYLSGLLNL